MGDAVSWVEIPVGVMRAEMEKGDVWWDCSWLLRVKMSKGYLQDEIGEITGRILGGLC